MTNFLILTNTDSDHESVMDIVRKRSLTFNNRFGGPGHCDTEVIGSPSDYKVFKEAIENGIIKGELEILSGEL